jgi:hypothetical protein
MPVVEYKMHRVNGGTRRQVPDFIGDRGYHMSPIDGTLIGWVDSSADYHVPDTLVSFTKEEFVQRQLTIHASHPFTSMNEPGEEATTLTDAEVRTQSEAWYDEFVTKNDV